MLTKEKNTLLDLNQEFWALVVEISYTGGATRFQYAAGMFDAIFYFDVLPAKFIEQIAKEIKHGASHPETLESHKDAMLKIAEKLLAI